MPADERLDQIQQLAAEAKAADVAEDAAYEQQIATMTTERDAAIAQRNTAQQSLDTAIAALEAQRVALVSQVTAIESAIAALQQP